MGLKSCISVIVNYSEQLKSHLDFDHTYYTNCTNQPIKLSLFHCNSSEQSRNLAKALGININDASTWHIDHKNCTERLTHLGLNEDSKSELEVLQYCLHQGAFAIFDLDN